MKINVRHIFIAEIVSLTIAVLSGCSGSQVDPQSNPDAAQAAATNIASSSESDEVTAEDADHTNINDQAIPIEAMELNRGITDYFGTTYGDHLKNGGSEAEFLHGGRYIAECPNMNASVIFEGMWHEDTTDYTIEDSSRFLRLEGNVAVFFTGTAGASSLDPASYTGPAEFTSDEFIKLLEKNYTVTSEYRESAGTAYYVSAEDYLHIELTPKDLTEPYTVIEIACNRSEKISLGSYCWVME